MGRYLVEWLLLHAVCRKFRVRVNVIFSVWLVSGSVQVFEGLLLSVVTVPLPAYKAIFSDTQMLIYVLEQMHAGFFESVSK